MTDKPLVSVVIPTHNRPDFLIKTLKSVTLQTYLSMEIFVISNGVNERNKQVVESLRDRRVIYIDQENSGGPSSPRNHGIRLSKGVYIAFCDDDDLWEADKIAKQVKALEEHPEYGLCYTKMLRFDQNHEWSVPCEAGPATFPSLLYVNTVPISSVFIKKSLLALYAGFSEDKRVGSSEDYEFLLRHAWNTKFYFIDEFLIKYWSGQNRTTASDDNRSIQSSLKHLLSILGCYYLIYKRFNLEFKGLLGPIIFHTKNFVRVLLYLILKKLGFK